MSKLLIAINGIAAGGAWALYAAHPSMAQLALGLSALNGLTLAIMLANRPYPMIVTTDATEWAKVTIHCDKCPVTYTMCYTSIECAEINAEVEGWIARDGKHLCPSCAWKGTP